jgi:hypothetical protein
MYRPPNHIAPFWLERYTGWVHNCPDGGGVAVGVADTVGVGVTEAVGVTVAVGVGDGVGDAVDAEGVGFGLCPGR